MAYIKVDHRKIESVASDIENYVAFMKNSMRMAQSDVAHLSLSWKGSDFTQFINEFNKVNDNDSTHVQMINALESYAKYLRFAANKYIGAQSRAINRAKDLNKW